MAITVDEYRWREWVLGEGEFRGKGPRSEPRPPVREKIPRVWWGRLEEFLTQRNDHAEKPGAKQPGRAPAKLERAPTGQLSKHFNVREFDCHNGRKVPNSAVPALQRLCRLYLEPLRGEFGLVKISSGYRPKAYNASIGGAQYSQHIYDLTPSSVASDVICQKGNASQWFRFLDRLGPGGLGHYPSFVHVDNRPGSARWSG